MDTEFKNLTQEKQKEFILKYYPLIFRRQQEHEGLSKLEFLHNYFRVKDKDSEHNGKLLISKSAYKRYLNVIRDIFKVIHKVETTGYERRTEIEPIYSQLKIPKLHQRKFGYELAEIILTNFDEGILQEIWQRVQKETWFERMIEEANKEDAKLKEMTLILLDKTNLLSTVYNTLSYLSENRYQKLESEIGSQDLYIQSFFLEEVVESGKILKNGQSFLNRFNIELNKLIQDILKAEDEFNKGLDRYYTEPFQRLDYYDDDSEE